MALSEDEIAQAHALLTENQRRLRIRERQIERQGDSADPSIILDAEDIRKKIMALNAILEPELPDEISGLVKRRLEDDYFIFQQTLGAKKDVALLREDVQAVKHAQSLAATERMQTKDVMAGLASQVAVSEQKRAMGAKWYRRALIVILCIAILALIVSCGAFMGG